MITTNALFNYSRISAENILTYKQQQKNNRNNRQLVETTKTAASKATEMTNTHMYSCQC